MEVEMKKIIKTVAVLIGIIAVFAAAFGIYMSRHPNEWLKVMASELKEDVPAEFTFDYDRLQMKDLTRLPVYSFTPDESCRYTFTLKDSKDGESSPVTVSIIDRKFTGYLMLDNFSSDGSGATIPEVSGQSMLQENRVYYAVCDVFADELDDDPGTETGTYTLTVTKTPETKLPEVLTAGESVSFEVDAEGQNCASFIPEETGYYRFTSRIVSTGADEGYASVTSVTFHENRKVDVTDGICMLEKGRSYYVWAAVNEISERTAEVELSCEALETMEADKPGEYDLTGPAVIEYKALSAENIAIYSLSREDPGVTIYETPGFILRADNDSEASLSENKNDFAVVMGTDKGSVYRICVHGDFTECKVMIAKYTGDGTGLGPEDIEEPDKAEDSDS